MAFVPESNNPRERRAYTHMQLATARSTGKLSDLLSAASTAKKLTGKKAERSGFEGAVRNIALVDTATRVIVEKTTAVIDSTPVRRGPEWSDTVAVEAYSPDYTPDLATTGVSMARLQRSSGKDFGEMRIVQMDGDRLPHIIPTQGIRFSDERPVDVLATRSLPDGLRAQLAEMVSRVVVK